MPRKVADRVLDTPELTLLDMLDRLLATGVMATGDVTLGVAGIDLIYLRLSTLICAADRVLPHDPDQERKRRHRVPVPRPGIGQAPRIVAARRNAAREDGLLKREEGAPRRSAKREDGKKRR